MLKRILVIDDQKEAADFTAMSIQKLSGGALTTEALYGGQACLDRIEKSPPIDLILLDLNMPGINGADIIRTLLKRNPLPSLKILITTAWGPGWITHWNLSDIYKTRIFKQLVCGTCDKSEDLQDMMDKIHQVVG